MILNQRRYYGEPVKILWMKDEALMKQLNLMYEVIQECYELTNDPFSITESFQDLLDLWEKMFDNYLNKYEKNN